MKTAYCALASVAVLTACNKSPEVDLHNATGNQVVAAVKESGMMSSDSMIEPGLWQSKVTLHEVNIPGMPPEMATHMKAMMAERQEKASSHCITAADVKKPKEDFFGGQDKSCHYAQFTMGGGRIDIQMVCNHEGMTQTMNMKGTYTPTTYSMDMASQGSAGGQGNMSMKMHVDSQRIGECSAKDG